MHEKLGTFGLCVLFAALLAVAAGFSYWQAAMEADAYNRVTGKQVSPWDAMFLDLRVEAPPVPPEKR